MACSTASIRAIAPVAVSTTERPFWSIMVPARNPEPRYLAAALDSVLAQDSGPADMQVEVLDDLSESLDVAAWVAEHYGSRVQVNRGDVHRGMACNWNVAVDRALGHWVHILHDDDLVRPGFYATLRAAVEAQPNVGAAFVFHHMIDGEDRILRPCQIRPQPAGILEDWVEDVFVNLKFQTPSIVVRRTTYEAVGGFNESYRFFVDWEMWQRIAVRFQIWYEPTPLAFYREHNRSTTAVGAFSRAGVIELRRCIEGMRELLPPAETEAILARVRDHYSALWLRNAWRSLVATGDLGRALRMFGEVRQMATTPQLARAVVNRLRAK